MTIFFLFITYTIFVSSKILPFAESLCTLTGVIQNAKIECFETVMHYHLYLKCLLKYHVDQVEASSK